MYSYLTDDDCDDKKTKGTKKFVTKRKMKFEDFQTCLEKNEANTENLGIGFRSEAHNVITEKVNKIALSASADKRLKKHDGFISYLFKTGARRVCKAELIEYTHTHTHTHKI